MTDVEQFFARVERLRVEDLLARAARPLDDGVHAATLARANEAARSGGVHGRILDAQRLVDDWVIRLFNRSTVQPGWFEANWGRPGTTADRANLAQSLGEAVTAIILGDRLDPADHDELIGAWADLVRDA